LGVTMMGISASDLAVIGTYCKYLFSLASQSGAD
jgi:hypothetical protein